jgi:hypothetical protein
MSILRELWHTWRASRRLLASRRDVLREQPALRGRELYAHVIGRRSGLHPEAAYEILERAHESCCRWPVDRNLRLRDLAYYLTVVDYLQAHPAEVGMRADIARFIARLIPETL